MKPSHCLCLLFLASVVVASSAVVTVSPKDTARETKAAWTAMAPASMQPDEAFLFRLCEQQRGPPLPWCRQLHASRRRGARHYLSMLPPSRDGEEIDPRYGVSKRLVPSGPNRLHN